ncbi:MAG: ATP-binding protein [Acidimicrobiales bacterium]
MKSERRFEPVRTAVPSVRSFLRSAVGRLPQDVADRVLLIASELATNAFLHARTEFVVRVDLGPSVLRIEVTDRGSGEPEVQPLQPPTAIHGRGLQIVDHLADRWGIQVSEAGPDKLIWVEVDVGVAASSTCGPGSSFGRLG